MYSDVARVAHKEIDFWIDFGKTLPEKNKIIVKTRVYLSPKHALSLLQALQENINMYENKFGKID